MGVAGEAAVAAEVAVVAGVTAEAVPARPDGSRTRVRVMTERRLVPGMLKALFKSRD